MKSIFGSIVVSGSGKLGGSAFSKGRHGISLKRRVVPIDRKSTAQSVVRSNMHSVSASWRALNESQRILWLTTTIDGLYGFALYSALNLSRIFISESLLSQPPTSLSSMQFSTLAVQASSIDGGLFLIFSPSIQADFKVIVFASKPVSQGIAHVYKQSKTIVKLSASNYNAVNLTDFYISAFGYAGLLGQKIILKIEPCQVTTGRRSQYVEINTIVTDAITANPGLIWSDIGVLVASQTVIGFITSLGNGVAIAGTGLTGGYGHLARTVDYGLHWTDLGTLSVNETVMYCGCYLEAGICIVGTISHGHILRSIDYGLHWTDLGTQAGETRINSIAYCGGGIVIAGTGGHAKILRSTDYGTTWSDLGQLGSYTQTYAVAYLAGGICLAGTYSGSGIYRSTDYGATWSFIGTQGETGVQCFAYLGGGIVLAGTTNGGKMLRSADYGLTWSKSAQLYGCTYIYTLTNVGGGIAIAGVSSIGNILRTTDYGLTWQQLPAFVFAETRINASAYLGNGTILVGSYPNGKILYSLRG
jgi:photosystem II stability/assembly factor-like uncharacterized protein